MVVKQTREEVNSVSLKDKVLMKLKKNKKLSGVLIGITASVIVVGGTVLMTGDDEEIPPPKEFKPITIQKPQDTKVLPVNSSIENKNKTSVENKNKESLKEDKIVSSNDNVVNNNTVNTGIVHNTVNNNYKQNQNIKQYFNTSANNINNTITKANSNTEVDKQSSSSIIPILPNRDVKLIGSTIEKAMKEAVREVVKEEVEKLREELKKEIKQNKKTNRRGKIRFGGGGSDEESERHNDESVVKAPIIPKLSNKIYVTSKIVYPDGEIMLQTEDGAIVVGGEYKGWIVRKITDKYIYLKKKKGKKLKLKRIPYKVLLSIGGV